MSIIAIGSLEGGGGVELGHLVAERLGADYVDRLILAQAAKHAGATVEALHEREERPPTRGERFARFLQRVLERSAMAGAGGDYYFGSDAVPFLTQEYESLPQPTITRGHEIEDEKYLDAIRKVMTGLAADGNVVIVGRGCTVILKDNPNVLRVGVVSKYEDRLARVMRRTGLSREECEKIVAARDKARSYFFRRLFNISNTMDPELFHLTINASDVSMDYGADVVTQAVEALEKGALPKNKSVAGVQPALGS